MAAPDFLSQLPSLDELLENQHVKDAIDRLNKSTAATRVRSALSGLTAEVGRAADNLQGIATSDWIERLVSRLDHTRPSPSPRAINATGDPLAAGWPHRLAPAAIEAMHAAAESPGRSAQATAAACRLLNCQAATLSASHAGALAATLEALASGGRVVVARCDLHEVAPGVRLDDLARRAGVKLREVGATDAATLDDYANALAEPTEGPTLVISRPVGPSGVSIESLAEVARQRGVPLVVDAGGARPTEATPSLSDSRPTAEAALRAGASLVLLDTAGRLGGPAAGLLVGSSETLDRVARSSAALAIAPDHRIDAAVAATISLFHQPDTLRFTHPLHQLLDAPLENLRSRAERLAPQLAQGPGVNRCEAVDLGHSWGVRLAGEAGLAERLEAGDPAICGRRDGEGLLIDLRSVSPREERSLVAAIAPQGPPEEEAASN